MIFRQLFDPQSSTYTYLLGDPDTGKGLLIDPVFEQFLRDSALVHELGLDLVYTLETHVHADHVTAATLFKERHGSQIAMSDKSGTDCAQRYLSHGDQITFGTRHLVVRETPGHTDGCLSFALDDESMVFTGDCLLIRGSGRTDFQQGDALIMYRSVHEHIFRLPDDCLVWPGHDYRGLTCSSVGEEKRFNSRLGGDLSESDFAGLMENLNIPHPRQIDIAVPANLKCGAPQAQTKSLDEPNWAPLSYTFGGIWEIQPHWLEEHLHEVQVIDVRESYEFNGDLGHIAGARLIPLGELADRSGELSSDLPVVVVCRAGGRSAQATKTLASRGFTKTANLAGGMLRWRAQHYPVEDAALADTD